MIAVSDTETAIIFRTVMKLDMRNVYTVAHEC